MSTPTVRIVSPAWARQQRAARRQQRIEQIQDMCAGIVLASQILLVGLLILAALHPPVT